MNLEWGPSGMAKYWQGKAMEAEHDVEPEELGDSAG